MKITIKKITIENFKNIERLEQPLGDFVQVEGANETGKTTFADAISWCLTGKNSLGESNPNIVPIDNAESSPTVALMLELDKGKDKRTVELKRVHQAKFNKAKEYTGEHQTVFFINNVKSSIKDFEAWIESHICNKEVFRLIHDVRYFTENIATNGKEKAWEAQRRLLFNVCGIKPDSDLAKKRKKFAPLAEPLSQYDNANQYLLVLKSTLKVAESRIKEVNQNIDWYDKQIQNMQAEVGGKTAEEIQQQIADLERDNQAEYENWRQELAKYDESIRNKNEHLIHLRNISTGCDLQMTVAKRKYQETEIQFKQIATICPTCGAPISEEKQNRHKEQLKATMEQHKQDYIEAEQEKRKTEVQIANLKKSVQHEPEEPQNHREYMEQLKALNIQLAKCEELAKQEQAIIKAEQERSTLLDNRAMLQQDIDLCQEFIAYKCEQATKAINSMFDGVTFELFRQNKTNDEVKECCDIFWQGVPYESLSYSTKFIIGLKIAQAFQKHYGVEMPLIVDNAESIDFDTEFEQQVILLIKTGAACPLCYCDWSTGRKQANGKWYCTNCDEEFVSNISIKNEQR